MAQIGLLIVEWIAVSVIGQAGDRLANKRMVKQDMEVIAFDAAFDCDIRLLGWRTWVMQFPFKPGNTLIILVINKRNVCGIRELKSLHAHRLSADLECVKRKTRVNSGIAGKDAGKGH